MARVCLVALVGGVRPDGSGNLGMDRRELDSPIGRVMHGGVRGVSVRAVDTGELADRRAGRVGSGGLQGAGGASCWR